jgi:hypothetical protein
LEIRDSGLAKDALFSPFPSWKRGGEREKALPFKGRVWVGMVFN